MKGVVDRFSEDFVETRMKALDKFLKRVADHPVLSFNPHLNAFLTAKVGWKQAEKVWDILVCFSSDSVMDLWFQDLNKRQGLALLTKVGESVKHVAGGYKLRARPAEFGAMGEYLDTFSQKLGNIDRIAQRILKEQSGTRLPAQPLPLRPAGVDRSGPDRYPAQNTQFVVMEIIFFHALQST